jgi:hypothetical protein
VHSAGLRGVPAQNNLDCPTIHRRSTVLPHLFHIASAAIALSLCLAGGVHASDAPLYRIFLQDGTTLISYGEFARVADRVVISIPIGDLGPTPNLQIVSIADSAVDWARTEQYADAVRADRYARTRGDEDFALLANRVAEALNAVAHARDPARRLSMAEEARRNLADWPRHNYGYRAGDVAQLVSLLDEVVAELRVAAGQSRFTLDFVAMTLPPPPVPLLPAPGGREMMEHALNAARLTPESAERVSLLRVLVEELRPSAGSDPWAAELHARVVTDLSAELRTDRDYAELSTRAIGSADARARRADVRGLQALIADVISADDRLGRRRPNETASLLAMIDLRLDAARRLRLARDAWSLRADVLQRYKRRVEPALFEIRRSRRWLEDIQALAGPSPRSLERFDARVSACRRLLSRVPPPPELEVGHGLLAASVQLSARAIGVRRNAVSSNDMPLAWEASSAAAGAVMMYERAAEEIDRLTSRPQFR